MYPLLGLLRCGSVEAQRPAEKAIYSRSHDDLVVEQVWMKKFITEGVILSLWEQLQLRYTHEKGALEEGFGHYNHQ
ncbi:hypothetical protein SUGI_0469650 [Cryptomeria japonica]|nr:hypothetical protein SUGI_0469650 [Cryptomeria japonica]